MNCAGTPPVPAREKPGGRSSYRKTRITRIGVATVLKEEGIRGLLRYCHRAGGPGREGRKLRYAPARKPNSITPDAWRRYATSKALPIGHGKTRFRRGASAWAGDISVQ